MIAKFSYTSGFRSWLVWLLLLALTTSCRFGDSTPPTPAPLLFSDTLLNGEALSTYTVQRGDIVISAQFPGTINLRRQAELFFEQDGRVKTINVYSGNFVRADAVLAELDIVDLQIQLAQAEWDLELVREKHTVAAEERTYAIQLAEQEIKIAELTLASLLAKELDKPGSVLPEEMAKAEAALTAAQLDRRRLDRSEDLAQQKEQMMAEATVRRLQEQIDQSRLVAPFDGVVYFILPVEEGQRLPVKAYEPVARLIDPTSLTIEANLPASEMELLTESMPVSVTLTYRPGVALPGVIQQLPFPFGTGGDTFVHISVQEAAQNQLHVGGDVQVYAEVQRRENVLWLPPQALWEVGSKFYAFVQEGDAEREAQVQIGVRTDERVEILTGLLENDIVVRK